MFHMFGSRSEEAIENMVSLVSIPGLDVSGFIVFEVESYRVPLGKN